MEGQQPFKNGFVDKIPEPAAPVAAPVAAAPVAAAEPVVAAPVAAPEPATPAAAPAPVAEAPATPSTPTPAAPVDIYEQLGVQEYKKFFEAAKAGKDVFKQYVDEAFKDYKAMPDQDVLREDFYKKCDPSFTKDERELLFERHLKQRYNLTGDEAEDKIGLLQMRADAIGTRNELEKAQAEYVIPTSEAQPKVDPQIIEQRNKVLNDMTNDPELNDPAKARFVTFGEGEHAYRFEAPSDFDVKDALLNKANAFTEPFLKRDERGEVVSVDVAGLKKLLVYAHNMQAIDSAKQNWYASKGEKAFVDTTLKNKLPLTPGQAPDPTFKNGLI